MVQHLGPNNPILDHLFDVALEKSVLSSILAVSQIHIYVS